MVVKVGGGGTLCVHRRQVMTGNSVQVGGSRGMSPGKILKLESEMPFPAL